MGGMIELLVAIVMLPVALLYVILEFLTEVVIIAALAIMYVISRIF